MKMSGWISVKDRLPEYGKDILVYARLDNEDHKMIIPTQRYYKEEKRYYNGESVFWGYFHTHDILEVEYWMPFPEEPNDIRE